MATTNQRTLLQHPLANEGENKINKWMNIWTLNKLKVLLYQIQVPLNFLLTIFFPLGLGDDGDWGGWSTGGSELSWTGTMKRSNGWQFECLFLCLVDKYTFTENSLITPQDRTSTNVHSWQGLCWIYKCIIIVNYSFFSLTLFNMLLLHVIFTHHVANKLWEFSHLSGRTCYLDLTKYS